MECLIVSRAFKKMINTLDHGSTKAKKVKTIGTYVERKGRTKRYGINNWNPGIQKCRYIKRKR